MTLTLALDCSTSRVDVALFDRDFLCQRSGQKDLPQSQILPQIVFDVLAESGRDLKDIKQIVFANGPGRFTSLRVGLATLMGLFLEEIRAVTYFEVSSLLVRALSLPPAPVRVAVMRAGRERCFAGILSGDDFYEGLYSHVELVQELNRHAGCVVGLDEMALEQSCPGLAGAAGQIQEIHFAPEVIQNLVLSAHPGCHEKILAEAKLNYLMAHT